MNTLLLRLAGPMQSWGAQSRFDVRDTGLEPSKSGVIGLVCASLGRPRDQAVDDLAALLMGVRVDAEGRMARDYHTALEVMTAAGGVKECQPSNRYYLAGARFLVGLAGEDVGLLETIQAALRDPVWPQFLGRKAFPPAEPVWLEDGLRRGSELLEALTAYPWQGRDPCLPAGGRQRAPERLRLVLEDPTGPEVRRDQPISYARRAFSPRRMRTLFIPLRQREEEPCTSPA